MSKTFKVGERAIYVNPRSKKCGMEVTIEEPLQLVYGKDEGSWFGYPTNYVCSDGRRLSPRPHDLRKKSGDGDGLRASDSTDLGSWDKVGWSPTTQPQQVTS
jgi:hypothetical protein